MKSAFAFLLTFFLASFSMGQCVQGQDDAYAPESSQIDQQNAAATDSQSNPGMDTSRADTGLAPGQNRPPSDTSSEGDRGSPNTMDTVKGTVDSIDTTQTDVNLTIMNDMGQSTTVILGPKSFLKEMNFTVKKGDTIEVIGTPTTKDGKNAITAYQLKKGETTLMLRDENGQPLWSGRGQSQMQ